MQTYLLVPDDSEWEDLSIYTSLKDAQEILIETVRQSLTTWPNKYSTPQTFDRWHIETFSGTKKMTPNYESYRLITDIPFPEWKEWILTETENYSQFFRLI